MFDPRQDNFTLRDLFGTLNLLWFQLGLNIAFVIYVTTLFHEYGSFAVTLILAVHLLALASDAAEFTVGCIFLPRLKAWQKWPYVIGQTFYISYFQRLVQLRAYFLELAFRDSYKDSFYPTKVRQAQDQF